jgi:glycosyltransferase involved in cell wall biosynthesis
MYDASYARNRVFIEGFYKNHISFFECKSDPNVGRFKKYFILIKKGLSAPQCDYVIVPFPGHTALFIARILFLTTPIVFDPFVSLYNSEVEDRQKKGSWSPHAFWYYFLDRFSCALSDIVLFDTQAHKHYFQKKYGVPEKKSLVVYLGTTPAHFFPKEKNAPEEKIFRIHFHGGFIPLQGVSYIISAAEILLPHNDILFRIIGNGQEYKSIKKIAEEEKLSNIKFVDPVSLEQLNDYLNESALALGIFGTTSKTPIVIPNKVYEAVAAGCPVITADTPAIRELFIDGENISLVPAGDAQALSEKILLLKNNPALRETLAHNAHELFKEKLTPEHLVRTMMEQINNTI